MENIESKLGASVLAISAEQSKLLMDIRFVDEAIESRRELIKQIKDAFDANKQSKLEVEPAEVQLSVAQKAFEAIKWLFKPSNEDLGDEKSTGLSDIQIAVISEDLVDLEKELAAYVAKKANLMAKLDAQK